MMAQRFNEWPGMIQDSETSFKWKITVRRCLETLVGFDPPASRYPYYNESWRNAGFFYAVKQVTI